MTIHYQDERITLHCGDALAVLQEMPSESIQCVMTSPPYFGLRDYGIEGQYGHEPTPQGFAETLRDLFREVRRVLAKDGTVWLNLGDSYYSPGGHTAQGKGSQRKGRSNVDIQNAIKVNGGGVPIKSMLGTPWRTALALQDDGWVLRNDIIWEKPNAMPESVRDRLTNRHEHVFLLSRSRKYYFDLDSIRVPALHGQGGPKNPGDVWAISTKPFPEAHFATYPPDLARRCIAAGCPEGGTVLDPFSGAGTTGMAALEQGKKYIGIDLNPEYLDLSLRTRLAETTKESHPS